MNPTENADTKKETVQSASAEKTTTVEDYFYLNPNADKDFKIKSSDKALEGNILEYIKWRKKQMIAEIQRGDVVSAPGERDYLKEYNEQNPNNTITEPTDVEDINNYAEKTLVIINSSDTLKQIMQTSSNESQILTTGNYNISSGRYTANRGQSPKAIAESLLTEGMACVGLPMTITLDTSKESKKIEEIAKFCAQRGIDASQITIKHSKGIEQLNEIEAVKDITATIKQVNGGIAHAFDNDYAMAEEMLQNPSNEQIDQLNIDDSNESTWLNIAKMETGSTFKDECDAKYLQKEAIKKEIPNISTDIDTDTLAWDLKALNDLASSTPATDINKKLDAIMKQHNIMGVNKNTLLNNDSLSATREAYFNADNSANIAADLKAGRITIATIESNIGPKGKKSSRDVIQEEYTALSNEINKIERDSSGITPEEVRSASILSKMLGNRMQGSLQAKIANVDKTFENAAADTFGGVIRDQKPIGTQVVLGRMIRDKEMNDGDWKNPQILGKDEAHIAPEHLAPLLKTYNEVTGKNVLTLDIRNKIEEDILNIKGMAEPNMSVGKDKAIRQFSIVIQDKTNLDATTSGAIATKVISKHFMSNGDLKKASIRDNIKIQADLMAEYRNHIVDTYGLTNFDATLSDNNACYKKHNKEQQQRGDNYAVSTEIHEQLKGLTKEIYDFGDQSEAIYGDQFTKLGPNPQPEDITAARKNFEDKANIPAEIRGLVEIPHTDLQKLTGVKPEDRLKAANKILQKYKTAATNEANRIKQEFNIPANTDLIQIKADNELPAQVKKDNTIKEEDLKKECEKALKVSNLYDSQHRGAQELTHIIKINQESSGFTNETIAIAAYRTVYEKLGDPATAKIEDINTQIANTLSHLGFDIDKKDKGKLQELQTAFEQSFKPDEQAAVAAVTDTAELQQEATAVAAPSTVHKTQIDAFKEKLAQLRADAKASKKQIQVKDADNHVKSSNQQKTGGGA